MAAWNKAPVGWGMGGRCERRNICSLSDQLVEEKFLGLGSYLEFWSHHLVAGWPRAHSFWWTLVFKSLRQIVLKIKWKRKGQGATWQHHWYWEQRGRDLRGHPGCPAPDFLMSGIPLLLREIFRDRLCSLVSAFPVPTMAPCTCFWY